MSKRLFLKTIQASFLVSFSIISLSTFANTQTSEHVEPEELRKTIEKQEMEVVEVKEKFKESRYYLKKQIELSELDFYEMFNQLAEKEKFKMKCRREATVGTRIKKTVCYPQYALDKIQQETQDAMRTGRTAPSMKQIDFMTRREQKESYEYMEKLIKENPKLAKAFMKMHQAQVAYQEYDDKKE